MKDCEIHIKVRPQEKLLGRAYIPTQRFADLYSCNEALAKGTVFSELDMPYKPKSTAGMR